METNFSENEIEVINPEIIGKMETVQRTKVEELRAQLAEAEAAERAQKEQDRIAYETLKSQTVISLCTDAMLLHEKMLAFKQRAFDEAGALYATLLDYSKRARDGKGNFQMESGDHRIVFRRQGKPSFDERADQAEKHIVDFLNTKYEGDKDTRDLIMTFLERKNGKLDIDLIQKLYAMENRFDDESWRLGLSLLKESYHYDHSKDYIRFELRDDQNQWNGINLQFSNV